MSRGQGPGFSGEGGINLLPIARYRGSFASKFGIPRQAGLAPDIRGQLVFEAGFIRDFPMDAALKGLTGFSHLWLIWGFSKAREKAAPTVRPPRLGGDARMGVFATRSPNRPNPLGLSCVQLLGMEDTEKHGLVLLIAGADLMDGSPIYDIKPYLPYADCIKDAKGGYADQPPQSRLLVKDPLGLMGAFAAEQRPGLLQALALDPRPAYQRDKDRIYGFPYGGHDVRFQVLDDTLTLVEIIKL